MDKWNSRLALYLIFPLLGLGCAQVGSPGGGETDEAPPLVVNADPVFGQTEFSGSTLRLTFDEFVKLKDARRQVLVSPPLSEPPRLLVKGRSVIVDLGEDLMPDRTYVVQFGRSRAGFTRVQCGGGIDPCFCNGKRIGFGTGRRAGVGCLDGLAPFRFSGFVVRGLIAKRGHGFDHAGLVAASAGLCRLGFGQRGI